MDVRATEIRPGIHRLSGFFEDWSLTINQFLIVDEHPLLIETGLPRHFEDVREAIRPILDPAKIEVFAVPHFEPDECGALPQFVAESDDPRVISSSSAAYASIPYFVDCPSIGLDDGQVIELGSKRIKHFFVPHVHSWDSSVFVEETEGIAFTADLFMNRGRVPIAEGDISADVLKTWEGYFRDPPRHHLHQALDKLESCELRMIAPVHGSALPAPLEPYFDVLRRYADTGK